MAFFAGSRGGGIGRRAGLKISFPSGVWVRFPPSAPELLFFFIMTTLAAKKYAVGTAKKVRSEGSVPGVIYGHGRETLSVAVEKNDFRRAFRSVGKSTLLEIETEKEKIPVLIHVVEIHPVSGDPIHIDFHAVRMDEEVHAVVPVKFVGISDAVKLLGGVLTIQKSEINIKCLPKYLISSIDIDISSLKNFHDTLLVENIDFGKNITVLDDLHAPIASVNAPRIEKEVTPAPTAKK